MSDQTDSNVLPFREPEVPVDPEKEVAKVFKRVRTDLASITSIEEVLKLRFGLVDGYSRTLEEVGRKFNVTRERIRQIEAKALRKMRHPTRLRKLEGFIEARD